MAASALYPLAGVPQLIEVLQGNKDGVSLLSWSIFTVYGGLFLVYGLKRRVWPMAINNGLWLIVDLLIIFGIIFV